MVSPCSIHMSPLWGFKTFVCRACYKHAAPLGLNAAELAARYRLWGRGFLAQRVGRPNPYGYSFGCSRSNFRASRILVRHVAPLGLWLFVYAACYKHAAPLGLNAAELAARYRLWGRGWGTQPLPRPIFVRVGPLWGFGTQSPTGWETHTASVAHVPIFVSPVFRFTCRPSGALRHLCVARAINMPPLWG